jgi:sRNA-binding protein
MIYSFFFENNDDDRHLKEQAKIVQKQSKQEEKETEEQVKEEAEAEAEEEEEKKEEKTEAEKEEEEKIKSKIDSSECEEVISEIELSKVEVSFSIKLKTSNKFVKCFIFEVTKKNDFVV